jgi:hypothetical protein
MDKAPPAQKRRAHDDGRLVALAISDALAGRHDQVSGRLVDDDRAALGEMRTAFEAGEFARAAQQVAEWRNELIGRQAALPVQDWAARLFWCADTYRDDSTSVVYWTSKETGRITREVRSISKPAHGEQGPQQFEAEEAASEVPADTAWESRTFLGRWSSRRICNGHVITVSFTPNEVFAWRAAGEKGWARKREVAQERAEKAARAAASGSGDATARPL